MNAPDIHRPRYGDRPRAIEYVSGIACVRDGDEIELPLLTLDDLRELPALKSCIKGVLPTVGLAAVAGPSGSGKTFLIAHMMLRAGAGEPCFGHRVPRASRWVYVGLEGRSGLPNRMRAHAATYGEQGFENDRFATEPLQITSPADLERLIRAVRDFSAGVVVIDTLNAAAPGLDENASADMGTMIEAAKRLQAAIDGLVILVHHTGKDVSRGLRGHSSLFAALDVVIEVTRDDARRSWRLAKSKDGADGDEHPFRLRVVELGEDDGGDPITSCVVEPAERAEGSVRAAKVPTGGNQRLIYDALRELLQDARTFGEGGAPPTRPCLRLEDAIAATRDRLTVESERKTERARQAFAGLINRGVIRHCDGWVYLS